MFWTLPSPFFCRIPSHVWPTSLADRALSWSELGATQLASQGFPRFPGEPLHPPPSPEPARGRRRTPDVGAPTPLGWSSTAAHVLGLFCSRCQYLEKRLRLDHRRLAGKNLLHEDAVDFLIPVCTAILEHDELIVSIGRPAHR